MTFTVSDYTLVETPHAHQLTISISTRIYI